MAAGDYCGQYRVGYIYWELLLALQSGTEKKFPGGK